jgi:predicted transcriptional regulator
MPKRTTADVIRDILSCCTSGSRKTNIMYRANLSYDLLKKYIKMLEDYKLIYNDKGTYFLTSKGKEFLDALNEYKEHIEKMEKIKQKVGKVLQLKDNQKVDIPIKDDSPIDVLETVFTMLKIPFFKEKGKMEVNGLEIYDENISKPKLFSVKRSLIFGENICIYKTPEEVMVMTKEDGIKKAIMLSINSEEIKE